MNVLKSPIFFSLFSRHHSSKTLWIFPLSNLQAPNKGKGFLCLAVFQASVKTGVTVSFCKFPNACSPQDHLTEVSSLTCFSMHFVKLPDVIHLFDEIVRSYFHLLIAIRFYS